LDEEKLDTQARTEPPSVHHQSTGSSGGNSSTNILINFSAIDQYVYQVV